MSGFRVYSTDPYLRYPDSESPRDDEVELVRRLRDSSRADVYYSSSSKRIAFRFAAHYKKDTQGRLQDYYAVYTGDSTKEDKSVLINFVHFMREFWSIEDWSKPRVSRDDMSDSHTDPSRYTYVLEKSLDERSPEDHWKKESDDLVNLIDIKRRTHRRVRTDDMQGSVVDYKSSFLRGAPLLSNIPPTKLRKRTDTPLLIGMETHESALEAMVEVIIQTESDVSVVLGSGVNIKDFDSSDLILRYDSSYEDFEPLGESTKKEMEEMEIALKEKRIEENVQEVEKKLDVFKQLDDSSVGDVSRVKALDCLIEYTNTRQRGAVQLSLQEEDISLVFDEGLELGNEIKSAIESVNAEARESVREEIEQRLQEARDDIIRDIVESHASEFGEDIRNISQYSDYEYEDLYRDFIEESVSNLERTQENTGLFSSGSPVPKIIFLPSWWPEYLSTRKRLAVVVVGVAMVVALVAMYLPVAIEPHIESVQDIIRSIIPTY